MAGLVQRFEDVCFVATIKFLDTNYDVRVAHSTTLTDIFAYRSDDPKVLPTRGSDDLPKASVKYILAGEYPIYDAGWKRRFEITGEHNIQLSISAACHIGKTKYSHTLCESIVIEKAKISELKDESTSVLTIPVHLKHMPRSNESSIGTHTALITFVRSKNHLHAHKIDFELGTKTGDVWYKCFARHYSMLVHGPCIKPDE